MNSHASKVLHRPLLVLALAALVLPAPGPAAAQQATPVYDDPGTEASFEKEFQEADTDKDGRLSEEEAKRAGFFTTDQSFAATDADRDGTVTLFELGDALQKRMRSWLSEGERADKDKDGYVSREEAQSAGSTIADVFVRADRDGDGRISHEEFDMHARGAFYSETADPGVVPNIINKKF